MAILSFNLIFTSRLEHAKAQVWSFQLVTSYIKKIMLSCSKVLLAMYYCIVS